MLQSNSTVESLMRNFRLVIPACTVFVILVGRGQAQDDKHDALVYGSLSRKIQPTKIKYPADSFTEWKHAELDHPATKQDVAQGKAVFTFDGLGERRVWKLPKCPIFCEWP